MDGKIQVIEASEYQRPNFTDMINKIWQLKQRYGYVSNLYVDAANPEVWQLITGLRTAVANEYKLQKEETSNNDIVDAFRLSLIFYKRNKE